MSYNHGKEERKWQRWKLAEEKVLRNCGMDESTIEQLRLWDRAMFNSDRRFFEKLQDTGTYLDSVAGSKISTEIYTVEDLLNDIENAELLKTLLTVDKLTLQISVLHVPTGCWVRGQVLSPSFFVGGRTNDVHG